MGSKAKKCTMGALPDIFYETVRQKRWDLDLSQAKVEEKASLREGFMSYLETGKMVRLPDLGAWARLCRVLGFSTAEALELSGYLALDAGSLDFLSESLKQYELSPMGRRRAKAA